MAKADTKPSAFENEFLRYLLERAMEQSKLSLIASGSGIERVALSEFRRSGYMGKAKKSLLRNWFTEKAYLPAAVDPGQYYRSVLGRLHTGWLWLRKELDIPLRDAAIDADLTEEEVQAWEEGTNFFLPASSMKKVLYKVLEWSNPDLTPGLSGEALDKQISFFTGFQWIENLDKSETGRKAVATGQVEKFGETRKGLRAGAQKKFELIVEVDRLNKDLPGDSGPVVICDAPCSECNKWTPAIGDYCMHCGQKLVKPKRLDAIFEVKRS